MSVGRALFLVFLAVPLIEIACFVLVGQAIGLWPTLAGVLVTALAGAVVLRRQGTALLAEIRTRMGRGELPARALADAMLVAVAGVLLLTPGYFTDLMGLLLLVPPVRGLIYAYLRTRFTVVSASAEGYGYGRGSGTVELDDDEWRPR
ncbi:FxsA family protein [Devosia sp.]|uniref:FxsA family protein n=1 Tax=Devosia sp. TaxID=1871048 RepID=UPI0035B14A1E